MLISTTGVYDLCVRKSITGSISYYQKYLSPLKGYSCAHRILHRGESCSQYVKRTFGEQNFKTALSMTRERFNECSLAALELNRLVIQSNSSSKNGGSDSECECLKCCCLDRESITYCNNCKNALTSPELCQSCDEDYKNRCSSPQKIGKCTLSCCTFGIYDVCCSSS